MTKPSFSTNSSTFKHARFSAFFPTIPKRDAIARTHRRNLVLTNIRKLPPVTQQTAVNSQGRPQSPTELIIKEFMLQIGIPANEVEKALKAPKTCGFSRVVAMGPPECVIPVGGKKSPFMKFHEEHMVPLFEAREKKNHADSQPIVATSSTAAGQEEAKPGASSPR